VEVLHVAIGVQAMWLSLLNPYRDSMGRYLPSMPQTTCGHELEPGQHPA